MDFQRILLFLVFSFSIYSLWEGWQREHQIPVQPGFSSSTPAPSQNLVKLDKPKEMASAPDVIASSQKGEPVTVRTDFMQVEINTLGGDITRLELLNHHDTNDKSKPFVVFESDAGQKYIAQTGLLGGNLPTHNAVFSVKSNNYVITPGQKALEVPFTYKTANGITVSKIFVFHNDSYLVDVKYAINNGSKDAIDPSAYFQIVRNDFVPGGPSHFVPTYTGPAFYTEKDKFKKVEFSSIEKHKADVPAASDNGWVGMLQHYFVSAWLPQGKTEREFFAKQLSDKLYSVGVILPIATIEPGKDASITVPLYVGPAQSKLDNVAEGLGLTVDYGFLTIIAKPIFWLLTFIHGMVGNWGVAIILLTVLIKLFFFPLSAASYRSMAKMRVVAPKLTRIKEQYANDREKLNRAMMDLYKTEKINPMGGCFPVLIQIPVFMALYWSIQSSVEMRYAPFFGWITDLSKTDPYFVLPVLMGVSMFVQSRLNPTPPDPLQAKMMQIMPLVFSIVFFFFPAGLVLYSIVNNVLSILQQWYINRLISTDTKGAA